jgi:uncharacterized protein YtpQ (UPF0354 family)
LPASNTVNIRRIFSLLFFGMVAAFSANSAATSMPEDDASFTKIVGERVAREIPEFNIQPAGKLTLEGKRADGESTGQISLDRIFAFCNKNSDSCDSAIEQYAKGISEAVRERTRPIEKGMIRLAIRSSRYVNQVKAQAGAGTAVIFARPLTEDLEMVPVLDFKRTIRFVNEKDLGKLGATEEEIFKLGEQNLRASLRPLADVATVPGAKSFGRIAGEDYASSRVILHADWSDLAAKLNNHLVVMIPAPDVLLYGDGSSGEGVDAIRELGLEIAKKSSRPLSPLILRWTDAGWEEIK